MNLISTTFEGQSIPWGLSMRAGHKEFAWCVHFRLPVLLWWRRGYDINWDEFYSGWWSLNLFLSFDKYIWQMLGLRFAYGWTYIGTPPPLERKRASG